MNKSPMMFTITGPSCAGKTTLMEALIERAPEIYFKLPSVTTRSRRSGEVDGDEYYFIDEQTFVDHKLDGLFCQTVDYKGVSYGTYTRDLMLAVNKGKVPIRVVEPTGVDDFRICCADLDIDVFSIFVNQSFEVILSRWMERLALDVSDKIDKKGQVDYDFYSRRIMATLYEEPNWVHQQVYDFAYDAESQDEESMQYMLDRIARGKIGIDKARRLTSMAA